MTFHIVASTGRTATTFIAACLDRIANVTACHEGYVGSDKTSEPLLPLINLENNLCYQKPGRVSDVVMAKRSRYHIDCALEKTGSKVLIDVAYYNSPLAIGILTALSDSKMLGIIRGCESFVRSCTCMEGEDPLPVGWPDPDKPLTQREKFISLGRMRPIKGSEEARRWQDWGAIERNIWLWQETNRLIINAKKRFPDRVRILSFARLKNNRDTFWGDLLEHFDIETPDNFDDILSDCQGHQNNKPSGYQIPAATEWNVSQQEMLRKAENMIKEMLENV